MHMRRLLLAVSACAILLTGCGERESVSATIIATGESGSWGCVIGTYTIVQTTSGHRAKICGTWGDDGDEIRGCWITGHWDPALNGFRPRPCTREDLK